MSKRFFESWKCCFFERCFQKNRTNPKKFIRLNRTCPADAPVMRATAAASQPVVAWGLTMGRPTGCGEKQKKKKTKGNHAQLLLTLQLFFCCGYLESFKINQASRMECNTMKPTSNKWHVQHVSTCINMYQHVSHVSKSQHVPTSGPPFFYGGAISAGPTITAKSHCPRSFSCFHGWKASQMNSAQPMLYHKATWPSQACWKFWTTTDKRSFSRVNWSTSLTKRSQTTSCRQTALNCSTGTASARPLHRTLCPAPCLGSPASLEQWWFQRLSMETLLVWGPVRLSGGRTSTIGHHLRQNRKLKSFHKQQVIQVLSMLKCEIWPWYSLV